MELGLWAVVAWLLNPAAMTAVPERHLTLNVLPVRYQDDPVVPMDPAAVQTNAAGEAAAAMAWFNGRDDMAIKLWPYVTVPMNKPTSSDNFECASKAYVGPAIAVSLARGDALGSLAAGSNNFVYGYSATYGTICHGNGANVGAHYTGPGALIYFYWMLGGGGGIAWPLVCLSQDGTHQVVLNDVPPAVANCSQPANRNFKHIGGQGETPSALMLEHAGLGAYNASVGPESGAYSGSRTQTFSTVLTQGQSQTFTLADVDASPMPAGTALLCLPAFGIPAGPLRPPEPLCVEYHSGPWSGGLETGLVFTLNGTQQLDAQPLVGNPDATSAGWSLPVGASHTEWANHNRLTLVSVANGLATVRLDYDTGNPPIGPQCSVTPNGTFISTVGPTVTDNVCGSWGLSATTWPPAPSLHEPIRNGQAYSSWPWSASMTVCNGDLWSLINPANNTWLKWNVARDTSAQYQTTTTPCNGPPPPVDTNAPSFSAATAVTSSAVSFTTTDNVGVVRVEVWLGTSLVATVIGGSGTVTVPLALGAPAVVTLKAFDAANNVATTTVTVK